MKASQVIQELFEYLNLKVQSATSNNIKSAKVTVCDLKEGDALDHPLICVLPIRDAVAGEFVRQDRVSPEIQIVCYAPNFYNLGAVGQIDDFIRDAMIVYPENNPPSNFHLVRRFLTRWIEKLSAFQSIQIYQFHTIDS
jgi:hypothetical protein